ncbi:MAG: hypothetical protein IT581_02795 [Verrucomicrobiales bacterium]|nr:hypothetical protein [Verrucomicrobiales bacterium]
MNTVLRWLHVMRIWVGVAAGPGLAVSASALPAVQNVAIDPTPLRVGEPVTLAVSATDVAQATATVDFRPWSTRVLRIPLSLQGGQWKGTGVVPADLAPPAGAEAVIKILLFNATRQLTEHVQRVGVAKQAGITAVYNPGNGILTVTGTTADNVLTVGRDGAGKMLVNGGAVPITGGVATIANTTLIRILGLSGNDQISLDTTNGALPPGDLQGGPGNDALVGGPTADDLDGGPGNDTLTGRGGADRLFGGPDNDTMIWNPGDGSDVVEGQGGEDTLMFNGANIGENIDLSANGGRFRFFRDIANIVMDCDDVESVRFNALGGADTITVNSLVGTDVTQVRLDLSSPAGGGAGDGASDTVVVLGTTGNDQVQVSSPTGEVLVSGLSAQIHITGSESLNDQLALNVLGGDDGVNASALSAGRIGLVVNGGLGADLIVGSQGNDLVAGGDGNDVFLAGGGDDTLVWNPGDDNDIFEGQGGDDTMLFNGANVSEVIDISPNGGRVRFNRNIANVVMDLNDVEAIQFNALGGADNITVNDVSGTDLNRVRLDLSSSVGSGAGDGQPDSVVVNGTNGSDDLTVTGSAAELRVAGGPTTVSIIGHEGSIDSLTVQGRGGVDSISASGLSGGLINLTLDGGDARDRLIGSRGADLLIGGEGDDDILWNPGDGSDIVEGRGGRDVLQFNGSNVGEAVDLAANGSRLRFFRNVANIVMDCAGIEEVRFHALGGSDSVVVNSLLGTEVTQVVVDLSATVNSGVGDGQADTVVVMGSTANDNVTVSSTPSEVQVSGLIAAVRVIGADGALDQLAINAQAGDDVVNAGTLPAGRLGLVVNGGLGADLLVGSAGDDLIAGGDGNDTVLAGGGDDTVVWNPGDDNDVVEGQSGADTLLFNGANIAERIDISANGGRVRFFRDIANVIMDLNDVETVRYNALGGADTIAINDLNGTDVTEVALDLASPAGSGAGDGQADAISVKGTNGDDVAVVTGGSGVVQVLGLSANVRVTGSEVANDRLLIEALAGDDVIEASGLPDGFVRLTEDGGEGSDILIGSAGSDTLLGGPGDDVLIGGDGLDVLDGGPGDDVEIQ